MITIKFLAADRAEGGWLECSFPFVEGRRLKDYLKMSTWRDGDGKKLLTKALGCVMVDERTSIIYRLGIPVPDKVVIIFRPRSSW